MNALAQKTETIDTFSQPTYRTSIFQTIGEFLGINKSAIPERTRDMVKELNPFSFIRSKLSGLFGGGKIEK